MDDIKLVIPRISKDSLEINLKKGDILFIVGPNGSGKSALMQRFALSRKFKWITAHRQTWISSAKNNLTLESRLSSETNRRSYTSKPEARWTDSHSKSDWSAILFDLEAKEKCN